MKKIISLLLVLVLSLGLLSGMALADYEMPAECAEAEAGVVVTCTGDASVKHYFADLSQDLFSWACHDLKGDKVITLLKDLEPKNPSDTSTRFLSVPANMADWEGRRLGKDQLILDLNGKTITFASQSNFINIDRAGMTLKNGTILYTCVGANRCPIMIGGSKGRTATTEGTTLWTPHLKLDNMNIFLLTEGNGGAVFQNYIFGTKVDINDSLLYTRAWNVIVARQTNQADAGDKIYQGDYIAEINITGSTLVSANNYAIAAEKTNLTVNLTDSTLVSNSKKGGMLAADTQIELNTNGQEAEEKADWTMETVAGTLKGTAYQFGDASAAEIVLPFEDVKEGDWFYEFVKEMYGQGIINGMTDTTFVPAGTLTYGQALKLIVVGMGAGEQPAGAHWASGYMDYAKKEGWIASDVDLNGSVSRLAFCQIAAKAKALTELPESNPFTDTTDPAVLALVKAGVISGMSADTFAPDQTLTRAQIAKILSLLLKL